jgi:hypothetical protein
MIDILRKYARGLVASVSVVLSVMITVPVVADSSVTALRDASVRTRRSLTTERLASFDFFVPIGEVPSFHGKS